MWQSPRVKQGRRVREVVATLVTLPTSHRP
jgi:hypothetical protein